MNLSFASMIPIFMYANFYGFALMLCLTLWHWHEEKEQRYFLNIQLETTKINFYFIYRIKKTNKLKSANILNNIRNTVF